MAQENHPDIKFYFYLRVLIVLYVQNYSSIHLLFASKVLIHSQIFIDEKFDDWNQVAMSYTDTKVMSIVHK